MQQGAGEETPGQPATQGRFKARGFFLTYSQVSEAQIDLVEEQLISKFESKLKGK